MKGKKKREGEKDTSEKEDAGFRVKIYKLSETGDWMDQGTGYVRILEKPINSTLKENFFNVLAEPLTSNRPILNAKIVMDDIYELQGDTLIVWNDYNLSQDLAISFQSSKQCCAMWDMIRGIQGREKDGKSRLRKNQRDQELRDLDEEEEDDLDDGGGSEAMSSVELPKPTINTSRLKEILENIEFFSQHKVSGKKKLSKVILEDDYLKLIFKCFHDLEDVNDREGLGLLNKIFQNIVLLNDMSVLSILFSRKRVLDSIGILEYDGDLGKVKQEHRKFLKEKAKFVEILEIGKDENLKDLIYRSYHLQYLKETVLPRILDDLTFSSLQAMITLTNFEIVKSVTSNDSLLKEVFTIVDSDLTSESELEKYLKFLDELISLIKSISSMKIRRKLFEIVISYGLLNSLSATLLYKKNRIVRQRSSRILLSMITYQPMMIRTAIILNLKKKGKEAQGDLLKGLVLAIIEENELSVQDNISDCLRSLLDFDFPGNGDSGLDEHNNFSNGEFELKNEFLNLFYDTYIKILVSPFESGRLVVKSSNVDASRYSLSSKNVFVHILDILCFCVSSHGYRSKNFVLKNDILKKITGKLSDPLCTVPLKLGIIRFVKFCSELVNTNFNNYMVSNDIFKPLFMVWNENNEKHNMLSSSIINLLETIHKNNIRVLGTYVVKNYKTELEKCLHIDTFASVLAKFKEGGKDGKKDGNGEKEDDFFFENDDDENRPLSQEYNRKKKEKDKDVDMEEKKGDENDKKETENLTSNLKKRRVNEIYESGGQEIEFEPNKKRLKLSVGGE